MAQAYEHENEMKEKLCKKQESSHFNVIQKYGQITLPLDWRRSIPCTL